MNTLTILQNTKTNNWKSMNHNRTGCLNLGPLTNLPPPDIIELFIKHSASVMHWDLNLNPLYQCDQAKEIFSRAGCSCLQHTVFDAIDAKVRNQVVSANKRFTNSHNDFLHIDFFETKNHNSFQIVKQFSQRLCDASGKKYIRTYFLDMSSENRFFTKKQTYTFPRVAFGLLPPAESTLLDIDKVFSEMRFKGTGINQYTQNAWPLLKNLFHRVIRLSEHDKYPYVLHFETVNLQHFFRAAISFVARAADKNGVHLLNDTVLYFIEEEIKTDVNCLKQIVTGMLLMAIYNNVVIGQVNLKAALLSQQLEVEVLNQGDALKHRFLQECLESKTLPALNNETLTPQIMALLICKYNATLLGGELTHKKTREGSVLCVTIPI